MMSKNNGVKIRALEKYDRTKNAIFCSDSDVNTNNTNNGEKTLRRAEEEEEEGERKSCRGGSGGYGAVEAWTDQDMDRVGVAS